MTDPPRSGAEPTNECSSVVVYRTGILYEADMVAEALSRAGIPYFRREESIGGLSFAMPIAPSMAPGDIWAIVVPATWAARAKHFIAELPVSQSSDPAVWGFRPPPKARSSRGAWIFGIGAGLLLLWTLIKRFLKP